MRRPYIWIFTLALAWKVFGTPHTLRYTDHKGYSVEPVTQHRHVQDPQTPTKSAQNHARANPKSLYIFELGSGWKMNLHSTVSFLPIPIAASALSKFYRDIMWFATEAEDASEDENMNLTIQIGQMFLNFVAAEQLSPVTWALVYDVANLMLGLAERGFTEGYHGILRNGYSLVVVRIGMKPFN